jgi:hypothetical protein
MQSKGPISGICAHWRLPIGCVIRQQQRQSNDIAALLNYSLQTHDVANEVIPDDILRPMIPEHESLTINDCLSYSSWIF